ncbi:hypothetical protein ABZ865_23410 [Streptomyces sp. NPDC047085]
MPRVRGRVAAYVVALVLLATTSVTTHGLSAGRPTWAQPPS